jgi:hypothetical protein
MVLVELVSSLVEINEMRTDWFNKTWNVRYAIIKTM